jgi:hypothetical protein
MDPKINTIKNTNPNTRLTIDEKKTQKDSKGQFSGAKTVQKGPTDEAVKAYISSIKNINSYKSFENFLIKDLQHGSHFSLVYSLAKEQNLVGDTDILPLLSKFSDMTQKDHALLSLAQDGDIETPKRQQSASRIRDLKLRNQAWLAIAEDPKVDINNRLRVLKNITDAKTKDTIYISIVQDRSMDVKERINILENIEDLKLKDDTLLSIAQEPDLETSERLALIEHIKNPEQRDFLIEPMIGKPDFQPEYLAQLATDPKLKDKAWLAIVQDTKAAIWERKEAIQNITQDGIKDKAWLTIAQDRSVKIEDRLKAIENITHSELKPQAYLSIIQDPNVDIKTRQKYLKINKNPEFRNQAYLALVQDTKLDKEQRLNFASEITDTNLKDQIYLCIAQDMTLNFHTRNLVLLSIQNVALKNEAAYAIIKDNRIDALQRYQLAQFITDEDIRDVSFSAIAEDSKVPSNIRIAAAASIVETSARDHNYSIIIQDSNTPLIDRLNLYNWLLSPEILHTTGLALCKDPTINNQALLYTGFLIKNQAHLVIDSMQASFEGLNEINMEAVRFKKIAAANAILIHYPANQEAQMIQYNFINPGPDSPYTLYKTVLAKCQEIFPLEQALEKFKTTSQERFHFSTKAFELPRVMDASWEDSFSGVNFDSFIQTIQKGCESYRNETPNAQNNEDNKKQEQGWLSICYGPNQAIFREVLNSSDPFSSHGNKTKKIALVIQDLFATKDYDGAFAAIDSLVNNLTTCQGGQQQAIEAAYLSILSSSQGVDLSVSNIDALAQHQAREKICNLLYRMRQNYVLENDREDVNGQLCIKDSPQKEDASFVYHLLKTLGLTKYDMEIGDETQDGNAKNAFNNTHIGLNINAIAGVELGLRGVDSHPPYDPNLYAAARFIYHLNTTKANIVTAFVAAFTFKNIHEALGKRLWEALETKSEIPFAIFEDEDRQQAATLASKDPLAKGAEAFLKTIGIEPENFNQYFDCKTYYYVDTSFAEPETAPDIYPVNLNIGFSKNGLAKILQKLDLLEDTQAL